MCGGLGGQYGCAGLKAAVEAAYLLGRLVGSEGALLGGLVGGGGVVGFGGGFDDAVLGLGDLDLLLGLGELLLEVLGGGLRLGVGAELGQLGEQALGLGHRVDALAVLFLLEPLGDEGRQGRGGLARVVERGLEVVLDAQLRQALLGGEQGLVGAGEHALGGAVLLEGLQGLHERLQLLLQLEALLEVLLRGPLAAGGPQLAHGGLGLLLERLGLELEAGRLHGGLGGQDLLAGQARGGLGLAVAEGLQARDERAELVQ